jgi:ribonuclease BN (tRNA processing enzyme)
MRLRFLGSGDAFGSGGRFNTCFLVEAKNNQFLIDCGASALIAIRKFCVEPNAIRTIFITHLHGDHFGGLPFFILDAQFYSRRTAPLTLVGPPGFRERLEQAMEVFFAGSSSAQRKFTTEIHELEPNRTTEINGVTVTPMLVMHACGSPPLALRLECEDKIIAYTGDTAWTDAVVNVARGADLLIAEALTFERPIKHHLDYASLRKNRDRISARRVILTHMGPDMLAHISDVPEEIAEDGLAIEV